VFDDMLRGAAVEPVRLPPRSPGLDAYAERFVRSITEECLVRMILFGEKSLRYVIRECLAHHHSERNRQGIGNFIPFPDEWPGSSGEVVRSERLGGLPSCYHPHAA